MRAAPYPGVRRVRRRPLVIAGAVLVALLVVLGSSSSFYTELLWFRETGFEKVFWAGVWVRAGLGAAFGAAFALLLLLNLWIARRITNPARLFSVNDQVLERYRATLQPYAKWVVIGAAVLFGLFAGSGATVVWSDWLLFRNGVEFGQTEPLFGRDIGFYVFRLPFLRFLFTWTFSTLIVVTLVTGFAHYFLGGIRPQAPGDRVSPEVRAHLSILLGSIVLLKAWGYRLDQFMLVYSPRGTVTGASYTDVNAQLPALRVLVVIAIVCAVFFFVNARLKNWVLPIAGIGLLALISIIVGGLWPAAVQRFQVTPNEQERERPYIQRNIDATRGAYGLDEVQRVEIERITDLNARDVRDDRRTVENIRLWDPRELRSALLQLQRIRQYYEFLDVDVDRYEFGGELRQIMLSAREIAPADLDPGARTWVNEHLVYTHGYGVVANRVDRVTGEGQPSFVIRNIPPEAVSPDLDITQPRIYYGENESVPFSVVNSKQKELDYPTLGDDFATNSYSGEGGIQLKGLFRRAAFAWRFRDVNLLISSAITSESRILFRRDIRDRIEAVAPFLRLDSDPYIAIVDGRLTWILDAYTTTDMYPYSERVRLAEAAERGIFPLGRVNYIRNSVKFTVDAEHGTIRGFVWDEADPIIKAWTRAFPGILSPRSEMPASVFERVRYPEGLFRVQTDRFGRYHITDADNFYSKEDTWQIANDPTRPLVATDGSAVGGQPTPPYYMLMKLPGDERTSFVLVRAFTPNARQNLSAYMVAHGDCPQPPACDGYGRLVQYVFPKRETVFGPEQVHARIRQEPDVGEFETLLGQQGSQVIRGNLLIVPIEDSLLYVQPIYVLGRGSELPELKRVVAVTGDRVSMGETLEDALRGIFGEPTSEPREPTEPTGGDVASLLRQALDHERRAQAALREGDFAEYGRQQRLMRQALERAAERAGAPATPTPSPTPSPTGS